MDTTTPDAPAPAACEPSGLMWACLTVSGTAAAETAVCSQHLTGYVPRPTGCDVRDLALRDVTGNDALSCTVCGATAEDLAYSRDQGYNVRPTTTVTFTLPATVTLTVTVDDDQSRYYAGAHRAWIVEAAVRMDDDTRGRLIESQGPPPGVVDAAEVERLARAAVDGDGIFPPPHWS